MKIWRFKSQKELDLFDEKFNYSGVLSCAPNVWIYGEGTTKHFTIQWCGDRWCLTTFQPETINKDFKPYSYQEFEKMILDNLVD